jgi:predicted deacylase
MPANKETRYLTTAGPEGGEIRIPLATATGASDGPTLLVVAGVHGSEYVGIEATKRLYQWVDAEKLRGTLITVPCLNLPAFYGLSAHINPIDGRDLGRSFPGDPEGSFSERLTSLLWNEAVKRADFVIDVHGGDLEEELVEYSQINLTGNDKVDTAGESLARALDMPMFLRRPIPKEAPTTGGLFDMASTSGIPAVLTEAGSHGMLDENIVAIHFRGLRNALYHLDMYDGEPTQENPSPLQLHRFTGIAAPLDGFWKPYVSKGEIIRKGQPVGEMQDLFGEKLAIIHSDEDAAILGVMTIPPRPRGSMLMGLGTLN